jgi:glycine oxidase
MDDLLIVGGGAVGLALAWELARHGWRVTLLDRQAVGREASWAGAGILPAARRQVWQHPYEQLRGLASELHPLWAEALKRLTAVDTGYRRCGGIHLAATPGEAAALAGWARLMEEEGVAIERLTPDGLVQREPHVVWSGSKAKLAGYFLPDEAQLRNPWYLRALALACRQAGVQVHEHVAVHAWQVRGDQLAGLETSVGTLRAERYCLTAGAWTGQLLARMGIATGILPIRGQMVLFRAGAPPIRHILNVGSRYLVPREDGRVLAGSTEEEAGFEKVTTPQAISELIDFARQYVPALAQATVEQTWAGLRPGSLDGLPYLGPLPGLANAYVAAGHFRSGLFLSPATARVMGQLLRGEPPEVDLSAFDVLRHSRLPAGALSRPGPQR